MPLQKQVIDAPFTAGQDEGIGPEIIPLGTPVRVTNGQFFKNGRINKRPGTAALLSTGVSSMVRLAVAGSTLLGLNYATGGSCAMGALLETAWKTGEGAPPWTVQRAPVFRDMSQTLQDVDVAVVGNYRCAVWRKNDDNVVHLLVTEIDTGTIVFNADVSAADAANVRIAKAVGSDNALVSWVYTAGGSINTLKVRKINCTVSPPAVGAETAIVADVAVAGGVQYDLTGLTAGRWAVSYHQNATDDLAIQEITAAPAAGLATTIAGTVTFSACLQVGANLIVPYEDTAAAELRYVIRDATTWGAVLGTTLVQAAASVVNVGVTAHTNGADAIIVWTRTTAGSASNTLRWAQATVAGVVSVRQAHYRLSAESKPFTDATTYWCWVRCGSRPASDAYALVELPNAASLLARPTCTAGLGQCPVAYTSALRYVSQNSSTGEYHVAVPAALATAGTRAGADELIWHALNPAQWQSVDYAGETYLSGGIVTRWDGLRLTECAVVQSPDIVSVTGAAGGALDAGATYSYVLVYEEIDGAGNRVRSVRSNVAQGTLGAGEQTFNVVCAPLTLLTRQQTTTPGSRWVLRLYRTEGNAVGDAIPFYAIRSLDLIATVDPDEDNNPFAAGDVTITDAIADTTIIANEQLYTNGGALDHDTVWGGAAYLWRNGPRLYGCDGEDGEIVWASLEEVKAEPAQFSIGLQQRFSGERIIAGAALDGGTNAYFSTEAIYVISGLGPNDTGNPQTGTWSPPQPISSDGGALTARSVIEIPQGVMYQGRRGLMLLDNSRQVRFVGKPVEDTLASFPTVVASCILARTGHVYLLVTSGEAQRVLVYDYVLDRWSVRQYPDAWQIVDIAVYGDRLVLLRSTGIVYQENPALFTDAGAWYGQTLEWRWLNFGSIQKFKRLWRMLLLTERKSAHGLKVEFAYDYDASYVAGDTITLSAADTLAASAAAKPLRFHMKHQKGAAWAIRISEQDPGAGAGEGFVGIGMSFELGLLPGALRLPAAASR